MKVVNKKKTFLIENSINSQTDVTASVKHSSLLLIRIVQKDYSSQLRLLLKIILKYTKRFNY